MPSETKRTPKSSVSHDATQVRCDAAESRSDRRSALDPQSKNDLVEMTSRNILVDTEYAEIPLSDGRLPIIDLEAWEGEPPPREFAWGADIPLRQTTMLTGPGGIGKSLLAQQMLTAIALGRPFLGRDTRPMPALYVTCEDDAEELWRRQIAICEAFNIDLGHLAARQTLATRLTLVSLCGHDGTALAEIDADGQIRRTERWKDLAYIVRERGIRMIAYDNATDAMAGDHNDVHQVASFVNMLTGLAIETSGAFLILHHPNKAEQDWLGSVAWHNKVRSRLVLKSAGRDGDADARVLTNPKANYAASGSEVQLRWYRGRFVADDELPESYRSQLEFTARAAADNDLFLACLREATRQQRAVSEAPSPSFAPAKFDSMSESKGIGRKRLEAAMDRLFRLSLIERGELPWKRDNRTVVHGLREVRP